MRTAEFIQRCLDAGLDVATALTAAKAFEAECEIALEAHLDVRRCKERARQAKHRAKKTEAGHVMSRDITLDDVTTVSERDLTHERSQVEDTTSSLRSEDKTPVPPKGGTSPLKSIHAKPNGFARFWEAYPNKVGKRAAEGEYERALKRITGPDPPGVILAGVDRAMLSRSWIEGYIPNPKTWLHQDRWADEPAEIVPLEPRKAHGPHANQPTSREDGLRAHHAGAMAALNRRIGPVG